MGQVEGKMDYLTGNTIHADGGGHINGVPWDPGLPDEPLEL